MDKKFKLKEGLSVSVVNAPDSFEIKSEGNSPYDRIICFVYSLDEMKGQLQKIISETLLVEKGYLFFAYPKKGNKQFDTYIARDDLFPTLETDEDRYALNSDIKFNSLLSLDETYTILALKREPKKEGPSKARTSQRVGDYVKKIPDLRNLLTDYPETLEMYDSLTPGYQRDWVRHIYSAKREETQKQRFEEMIDILGKGFKTKELYKQYMKENGEG